MLHSHDDSRDEEIFIGKLTLKEVKKHILGPKHVDQILSKKTPNINTIKTTENLYPDSANKNDQILFKTDPKSELSPITPELFSDWDIKNGDDSFLRVEKMLSQGVERTKELDNTLDIVNYIVKSAPTHVDSLSEQCNEQNTETLEFMTEKDHLSKNISVHGNPLVKSPVLMEMTNHSTKLSKAEKENILTPAKIIIQKNLFKTPGKPISQKKSLVTSAKKTPIRNSAYQHIASPVAEYIRNIPAVPSTKNIKPIKTTASSIPKLIKTPSQNKPNEIILPNSCTSTKKTKVINDTNEIKAQNVLKNKQSSLPRPII